MKFVFGVMCLRYVCASAYEYTSGVWGILTLASLVFGASSFAPFPTLFAFVAALPLLSGLGETALLPMASPPMLVFSSLWLGHQARKIKELGNRWNRQPESFLGYESRTTIFVRVAVNLIISATTLSAMVQVSRHSNLSFFSIAVWRQPTFGFGDPFYFLGAAFVWLQGLFFFQFLCDSETHINDLRQSRGAGSISTWIMPVFLTYTVSIPAFLAFQYFFSIPSGWVADAYFSPFDDISSFGSISVVVFIFGIAVFPKLIARPRILNPIGSVAMLIAVIASYSRAAWLAASLFLLQVCWVRLRRRWAFAVIGSMIGLVLFTNLNADRETWRTNSYLARLVALVRFENPANKDSGRINLYRKAFGMIREHPIAGNLIGSFYLTSPKYAVPDDSFASRPDFAHNVFLQLAAELGVPIALLFAMICGCALFCACSKLHLFRIAVGVPAVQGRPSGRNPVAIGNVRYLILLGTTLALSAYLLTQMTANSLNVYASNQIIFWFLIAAALVPAQ